MPAYGQKLLDYLQCRGDLAEALERGEHIELSEGVDRWKSPLFVFPLQSESRPIALLAVEFPPLSRPSHDALARLRRLCRSATPLLAALGEPDSDGQVDQSRSANLQLAGLAQVYSHVLRNSVHELRTPVMAIRGYARLLLREQAGPLVGLQQEYLATMLGNVERMIAELNGLSELGQSRPVRLTSFDLSVIWAKLVRQIQAQAEERSVRIEERFSHRPCLITADADILAQALGTLLPYAIKRTADGGLMRIEFNKGEDVVILITAVDRRRFDGDEAGSGASPDELNALSTARGAVRLHGGTVSISSGASGGLVVTVTLPLIGSKPEDVHEQAFNTCRG
jgi:signal transduction histidine kinase